MEIVSFTEMKNGTKADFVIIANNDIETAKELPDRLIEHLRKQKADDGAYRINRLQHVLQCATRAEAEGADDDWIAACLIHDIGDVLAPFTHGDFAAEIIKPFVSEEVTWVVRHHPSFQKFYNKNLSEDERMEREKYRDNPFFESAVDFCENWDQCSFDPDYETKSLEHFVPVIRRVFMRKPHLVATTGR